MFVAGTYKTLVEMFVSTVQPLLSKPCIKQAPVLSKHFHFPQLILHVNEPLFTHLSLASFLWDIGKQHNPGCDAAFCYGAILFAHRKFIEKWDKNEKKNHS